MVKKIAFALAAVGLSCAAFAGHPGEAVAVPSGVNLIAPDSVGVWAIGLEALYMQPNNPEFQYAQIQNNSSPVDGFYNKVVDPDHDWGGTIDLAYMFPGNSRDVKLAYTWLHMDNGSGDTFANSSQTLNAPVRDNLADGANTADADTDYKYDAIDLVFGQWIRIGDRVDLHPFGGLRWARVDLDDDVTYTNSNNTSSFNDFDVDSNWDGIGPRAGLDAVVHVGAGFSFVGTVGASLLVGEGSSKFSNLTPGTTSALDNDGDGSFAQTTYNVDEGTYVVPELDARLGINYTYSFNPATALGIEIGYQAVNYFNVANVDYLDAGFPNSDNFLSDFGYQGPYLRLQLAVA